MLVNNAAHDERHKFDSVTPEYWDERMAVNLRHQFFAAQAVHPMMKAAGGGSIVNFGSVSWMIGQGGMPGYTAAKSAVMGLTRASPATSARQHPRQLDRARLDHDRAPGQPVADGRASAS